MYGISDMNTDSHSSTYFLYGSILAIMALSGILTYQYYSLKTLRSEYAHIESELSKSKEDLVHVAADKEREIQDLNAILDDQKRQYALSEENGAELLRLLNEEKDRNDTFEKKISKISGTVGKLDKLSKIDPELLKKYSKVYFLNENYIPKKLDEIASTSRFKPNELEYINSQVAPFLSEMLSDAEKDGIHLLIASAYRSFTEQKGLKSAYTTMYGSGANTFSADQGYSEHQLGTTLDFTTQETGGGLVGFNTTDAYMWLEQNAHKYGFVLSYPKDNGYYIFEPWHWRFVGEKLANDLHDSNQLFYNLDQRSIDAYLISLFD
jgi:D-alanyl-D-alanine carboxypeptidase